jgi:ArsR family transcriptional regulator, cadmium/lead-responsive transcriptional repressor
MTLVTHDDTLWEAMTDPTRRNVLDLLVSHGHATATSLTEEMTVSRQAISKHLAVLERAGLVEGHRHGREVHYKVRAQRVTEATNELSEVANRWNRRLRMIKRIAEEVHAAEMSHLS